jgi:Zn-dependent peptidase ImmA (M78 family)
MPKDEIIKDLAENVDLELLAKLKGKWKASMHAILYRAVDLQVITENQKRYLINEFNKLKIRRREPKELDLPIERGRLLRDLITTYRTKQKMNVKQIASFFHLHEDEFLERYN